LASIKDVSVPPTRRGNKAARPLPAPRPELRAAPAPAARPLGPGPVYHVGQRLILLGGGNRWARTQSPCRVLAVLPHDTGPFTYRVRSEAEAYERIVVETDLMVAD
jgi:hypothetical protein